MKYLVTIAKYYIHTAARMSFALTLAAFGPENNYEIDNQVKNPNWQKTADQWTIYIA